MQDFIIASAAPMQNYTPISAAAIAYEPQSSKLILFPGWLPHGVERNTTEEDRVSVSFNVKLVRTDDERLQSKNT
jgi:ectoine hydroxylase-related dioxygenase (phytanoyl-CoA dioxygenase family)